MPGLLTRAQAEALWKANDGLRAQSASALCEGLIDSFRKMAIDRDLDRLDQAIKNKLAATRLILADKELTQKSMWFAFVLPRRRGWLMRRGSSKWVPTSEREVEELKGQGVSVIYCKSQREDDPSFESGKLLSEAATHEEQEPEAKMELKWIRCSVEEGRERSIAGCMVRWIGEGEERYAEYCEVNQDSHAAAIGAGESGGNFPDKPAPSPSSEERG